MWEAVVGSTRKEMRTCYGSGSQSTRCACPEKHPWENYGIHAPKACHQRDEKAAAYLPAFIFLRLRAAPSPVNSLEFECCLLVHKSSSVTLNEEIEGWWLHETGGSHEDMGRTVYYGPLFSHSSPLIQLSYHFLNLSSQIFQKKLKIYKRHV